MSNKSTPTNSFEEIPVSHEDFKNLISFLMSFMRVTDPTFESYLYPLMKCKIYAKPDVIQKENKQADKAFYIAEGMVYAFYYNEDQEIVAFRIFNAGEIALIPESFMTANIARYSLMACAGSRLLEVTLEKMMGVYSRFPQAVMLALMITASLFDKDLVRNRILEYRSEETIRRFYQEHPDLYGNTRFLFRDKIIAKYLHLSPITFSRIRKKVFPNYPDD